MIVRWILLLGVLHLAAVTHAQDIPQCFRDAASTGNIECTGVSLVDVDETTLGKITNLQVTKIKKIFLIDCRVGDLKFLESSYVASLGFLYMDRIQGLTNSHLASLIPVASRSVEEFTLQNTPSIRSIDSLLPTSLDRAAWSNLKKLKVKNNAISAVNGALFKQMNAAEEYDFSYNSLSSLSFSQHNAVSTPRKILLNNNNLVSVIGLEEFFKLEQLDVSNNQIQDASSFANAQLQTGLLRTLDLSNNKLRSFTLPEVAVVQATTLTMDLSNNEIISISKLGTSAAKHVRTLDISENQDLLLEGDTFSGLSQLRNLKMSGCGLTKITGHLKNLPELLTVELQRNSLSEIAADAFSGSTKLTDLQLQDNDLTKVEFITSGDVELDMLHNLDISRNQLDKLSNFVSAPSLHKLKMDGSDVRNEFRQLSYCDVFDDLPQTLKFVCARDILDATVNSCQYRTFLDLLKVHMVIFNNEECCDRDLCNVGPTTASNYPQAITCGTRDSVCSVVPVNPGENPNTPGPGDKDKNTNGDQTSERPEFKQLYTIEIIVMALGFIIALLFLIMVIILFVRRYRSYDKWLEDYRETGREMGTVGTMDTTMQFQSRGRSMEDLDSVDGKLSGGSPKYSAGTLTRGPPRAKKSFDDISMVSGFSQSSVLSSTGKSPFMGRRKFKEGSIDLERQENGIRYTNPSQRKRLESQDSAAAEAPPPSAMYSYATSSHSHLATRRPSETDTPPTDRRRHRSGGAVGGKLRNADVLDMVDGDWLPPKVQVVLQRKATDKRNSTGAPSSMVRNTRPYGSAPYRHKGNKGKGGVQKRHQSPMLTVNRIHRISKQPRPLSQRALPDLPDDSLGNSAVSSQKSISSAHDSNSSKLSHQSFTKNDDLFLMDRDGPEDHETYAVAADLSSIGS